MSEERTNYVRAHASVQAFVSIWKASSGAERANYQLFLTELCQQLDVPLPEPTKPDDSEPKVQEILTALASIGQAREVAPGAYAA